MKSILRAIMPFALAAASFSAQAADHSGHGNAAPQRRVIAVNAATVDVSIQSFAFQPASLTITEGTTVRWTNSDGAPHSVVSDGGVFTSTTLTTSQTFSFTFNDPGVFPYHCGIHTSMLASITVVPVANINISSFQFSPSDLVVDAGSFVRWTNLDTSPHTATSNNGTFNSPTLAQNQSFEFEFTTIGAYPYHCGFHPSMTGTVTVTATPVISSFSPLTGSTLGGQTVVISGSKFVQGVVVTFGGTEANITSFSSTSLSVVTPPHPQGLVSIIVTNPGDRETAATSSYGYVTPAVAIVTSVSPDSGAASGEAVTIAGENFEDGAVVRIGGVEASGLVVESSTEISATTPPLSAGALHEVSVENAGAAAGSLSDAYFANFLDVPGSHGMHAFIEKLVRNGVTRGCGGGSYCPDGPVTRGQMAVFLLRAKEGPSYFPPAASGSVFLDVSAADPFAPWIEELARRGITGGCGGGNYCPASAVTRAQMAVLLLVTLEGSSYAPPDASGDFFDVPTSSGFARWIEELAARGITAGCGGGNYCPETPLSRSQMAVFIAVTFSLP